MHGIGNEGGSSLASLYATSAMDVPFSTVLSSHQPSDDSALAELIESDGRLRIAKNREITLERYLEAVPDLLQRSDPLDAALDVTLRWLSRSPRAAYGAVETLIKAYPSLEDEIRDAASLNNALWSTEGMQDRARTRVQRTLPEEFGPPIDNGILRYQLQEKLGEGSFGVVYRAIDRQLSEVDHAAMVAVKVLAENERETDVSGQHLLGRPRLVEEATKARRVDHPNVVRVLDRGVSTTDETYIVYELIDGGDLERWLQSQDKTVPIERAVHLVERIARGVQAAHAAGLVHCDLKPGNIMLTSETQPKVADFGIAIRFGQSRPEVTQSDDVIDESHPIGNLAFISPEQFRMDEGALTVPSDVYALGGILYYVLTGELPNGDTVAAITRTHHRIIGRTSPPSPQQHRSGIDCDLDAICRRAMAIKPEDRYSSAGALADDLQAWLRREPLYWTNPSVLRILNLWRQRKPAVAMATGALVLSILGGVGASNYYAQRAAAARVDAALAQAAAEVAEIREQELANRTDAARQFLIDFRTRLSAMARQGRTTSQLLPMVWSVQYLLRQDGLAMDALADEVHGIRFDAVKRSVQRLEQEGRINHLDALLWQTTLAFWLVASGEIDDAQPMLGHLRSEWSDMLHEDDRWLGYLSAIEACASVQFIERSVDGRPTIESDIAQQLQDAAALLETQQALLLTDDAGSPLHLLILETLERLYGPGLLDQPEAHMQVVGLLAAHGGVREVPERTR